MGLPFRRQPLGNLIQAHELGYRKVARALKCNVGRVNNLVAGRIYPTAAEIETLELLIGLPVQTMFEPDVLKFFNPDGSVFSRARREGSETDQ